jgi:predicted AlkP superfamily phosphohydrolase/phosphomutase
MRAPALTVIGLDAATFDVLDPLLEAGQVPALQRLFEAGSRGTLRSTIHPLTSQAWATMVTGVNAGRHGLWDFAERDESGYTLRLVNGSYRRAPAVWDRLHAAGRRVGIVNIPFTWPAPEVDGFALAGLDASDRDRGMTFPAALLEEARSRFGELVLDHHFPLDARGKLDLDLVRRAASQRVELVTWLADRDDPELLFVVFMAADHIHHVAWPDWEERGLESDVAEVYRILDGAVGELHRRLGDEADVLVVSDHGGGRLDGVVNLNAWLAREGFLTYTEPRAAVSRGELVARLMQLRHKVPPGLRKAVRQHVPRLREKAHQARRFSVIDFDRSRAFSYGTFGNIVVNVRGRESRGIVEPGAEYDRVRDELVERALDLRGPEGEPIVAAVHRREELFSGPYLAKVPDLVVEFTDYAWLGKGNMTKRADSIWDEVTLEWNDTRYVGSHRQEGIVALSGPSAARGNALFASIEDVAPTILYLLGEPIPAELEGRLLAEAVDPQLLDARPPAYADPDAAQLEVGVQQGYSEDEDDAVHERLRGLGYLE